MVLSAGSTEGDVVAGVEDDSGLGKDSVVLNLCLADGGAIVGEDDKLGFSGAQGAQGGLISKHVFATLDDEGKLAVDVLSTNLFHHSLFINILNYKNNSPLQ